MKPLTEQEFKEYVVKKAKEYIFGTTDNLKESVLKEGVDSDVTLDSVKMMVDDLKKMNATLSLTTAPESASLNESTEPERAFKVGSYENESIQLKGTLSETMNNYNNKKSLKHGGEGQTASWERLVDYKKYQEEK